MVKTYSEQLDEVQAAISAILSGAQEYEIAGRRWRGADLRTLQERERYLMGQARREQSGRAGMTLQRISPTHD
jgi:hypothetical protein